MWPFKRKKEARMKCAESFGPAHSNLILFHAARETVILPFTGIDLSLFQDSNGLAIREKLEVTLKTNTPEDRSTIKVIAKKVGHQLDAVALKMFERGLPKEVASFSETEELLQHPPLNSPYIDNAYVGLVSGFNLRHHLRQRVVPMQLYLKKNDILFHNEIGKIGQTRICPIGNINDKNQAILFGKQTVCRVEDGGEPVIYFNAETKMLKCEWSCIFLVPTQAILKIIMEK